MTEVFNVLYKGNEIKVNPFCKVFLKEEDARKWIEDTCDKMSFKMKSSLNWNEEMSMDDYRVEDEQGNSYYFVIFRQSI
jgi:hypothetical protein